MKNGKKSIIEKIIYNSFIILKQKTNLNPFILINLLLSKIEPLIELKIIRLYGKIYQIPIEIINNKRKKSYAYK
jgi:small subunit ribosomal protein S7